MFWWSADHPVTDRSVTNMFSSQKKFPQINNMPVHFWLFGILIGTWVNKHLLMELCNPISDPIFANNKKVVFFWSLFLRVFKRSTSNKFSITLFIWHFKVFKVLLLQRKNICNIGPIKNHNQFWCWSHVIKNPNDQA